MAAPGSGCFFTAAPMAAAATPCSQWTCMGSRCRFQQHVAPVRSASGLVFTTAHLAVSTPCSRLACRRCRCWCRLPVATARPSSGCFFTAAPLAAAAKPSTHLLSGCPCLGCFRGAAQSSPAGCPSAGGDGRRSHWWAAGCPSVGGTAVTGNSRTLPAHNNTHVHTQL